MLLTFLVPRSGLNKKNCLVPLAPVVAPAVGYVPQGLMAAQPFVAAPQALMAGPQALVAAGNPYLAAAQPLLAAAHPFVPMAAPQFVPLIAAQPMLHNPCCGGCGGCGSCGVCGGCGPQLGPYHG